MKIFLLLLLIPNLSISQFITKQSRDGKMPMSIDSQLAYIDDKLILIGGSPYFNEFTSAVWESSNDGKTWQEVTSQSPFGKRAFFSIVVHKKNIYIIGGEGLDKDNNIIIYNDVWRSPDKGRTWIQVSKNLPFRSISAANLISINNKLYLIGGLIRINASDFANYYYSNDVWKSSDHGKTWRKISGYTNTFPERAFAGVLYYKKKIYIIGGIGLKKNKTIYYNDVWVSEDFGHTWSVVTKKAEFPAGVRSYVNINGRFFAIYGYGNKKNSTYLHHDIWESNNLGKTWKKIKHNEVPRGEFAVTPVENGFIFFGGYDNCTQPFDPKSTIWHRDTYKYHITNQQK